MDARALTRPSVNEAGSVVRRGAMGRSCCHRRSSRSDVELARCRTELPFREARPAASERARGWSSTCKRNATRGSGLGDLRRDQSLLEVR